MGRIEEFLGREPIVGEKFRSSGILGDNETVKGQSCPNTRCRGNVDYHCVYYPHQYETCLDKDAKNDPFFTSD